MKRDEVFRERHSELSSFAFDENVADVFADMLKRSVPGYGIMLSMLSVFASKYVKDNTNVYDLGASLGASSFVVAKNMQAKNAKIFAVDNSEPMVNRLKDFVKAENFDGVIIPVLDDICNVNFEDASLTILNLTLQFIKPEDRLALLKQIYDATIDGGIVFLSEKISDTSNDEIFTELYYDFKRLNDYSELEISQKRTALENVLITDTEKDHIQRFKDAGFSKVERWFQTLNFRSYVAWK